MTLIPQLVGGITSAPVLRGMSSRSTDLKEALQESIVGGILAAAGCNSSRFKIDDGIDLHVTHSLPNVEVEILDIQLKAVTNGWNVSKTRISASLSRKRFDEMRAIDISMQKILVIMDLPPNVSDWSRVSAPYTLFKHCSYWVNLAGMQSTTVGNSVSVSAPVRNVFDDVAVCQMFARIRAGQRA